MISQRKENDSIANFSDFGGDLCILFFLSMDPHPQLSDRWDLGLITHDVYACTFADCD